MRNEQMMLMDGGQQKRRRSTPLALDSRCWCLSTANSTTNKLLFKKTTQTPNPNHGVTASDGQFVHVVHSQTTKWLHLTPVPDPRASFSLSQQFVV